MSKSLVFVAIVALLIGYGAGFWMGERYQNPNQVNLNPPLTSNINNDVNSFTGVVKGVWGNLMNVDISDNVDPKSRQVQAGNLEGVEKGDIVFVTTLKNIGDSKVVEARSVFVKSRE